MPAPKKLRRYFFDWENTIAWARDKTTTPFEKKRNANARFVFQRLPPPASRSAIPPSASTTPNALLQRALVINNLPLIKSPKPFLDRIRQGALEYVRWESDPTQETRSLTLSFLTSSSAAGFVQAQLSSAARFRKFSRRSDSVSANWEWLPPTLLPQDISDAVGSRLARRSICISWPESSSPSPSLRSRRHDLQNQLKRFGPVLSFWQFDDWHLITSYYNIRDAIHARRDLEEQLENEADVRFFPDWTEVAPRYRYMFWCLSDAGKQESLEDGNTQSKFISPPLEDDSDIPESSSDLER
ncbi:hypothetical protein C8F01DRAFT_1105701 [Mycena amicta]|nr:hypothetical protein C8F01DRAFT_1105701 [Mycena amicta]